ncbi:MAG: phosphatidate cytidylyltransferase [Lachnospiraceae bacterium]|nr:phosphatidate cytidylyltransferase [Lachnospiraceae bacterium]
MLKQRVVSGIVIALIGVTALVCGGYPLWCLNAVIVVFCAFELFKAAGIQNNKLTWIVYPLLITILLFCRKMTVIIAVLAVLTLVFMTVYVFVYPRIRFAPLSLIPLSLFYIGILGSSIYLLRTTGDGAYNVILYVTGCFGTDIFAYFVGSKFGKHHPFPVLSPKKSVEGCIGGIVCSTIIGCILTMLLSRPIGKAIWMLPLVSVFSEIGDLAASGIKRQFGIKDYSNLIPGHGGMLDRFDSSLFAGGIILICTVLL